MKVLDLFSGIGGFSLGLERAGFETKLFCEIDSNCHKVLNKHWPEIPIHSDIKKLKIKKSEFDLICGGFPCQDISIAGKKKGLKGERSGLWKEFKRLIKKGKPRYVIIENVANLRSNGLNQVLKDIWALGYDCEWHIISARSVGAYHLRERVWIIAYSNSVGCERDWINRRSEKEKPSTKHSSNSWENKSLNSNLPRLWRAFASEEESSRRWAERTSRFSSVFEQIHEIEPTVRRGNDGFSSRLDERARKERIKQLGNSVVPQIPQLIGEAIQEWENAQC